MAFSKTPRILINDEMALKGENAPGPGDYNPKGLEKRIQVATIHGEVDVKRLSTGPGKISYLSKKDTSHIQGKLKSSTITIQRSKVKQMEKRIDSLEAELTQTREESEAKLTQKEEKVAELEERLTEATELEKRLRSEIGQQVAKIGRLDEEAANRDKEHQQIRAELAQLELALNHTGELISAHGDEIAELKKEAADVKLERDKLEVETKKLNQKNDKLHSDLKSSMAESERHQARAGQFESELCEMRGDLRLANQKLDELVKLEAKTTRARNKAEQQLKAQLDQFKRLQAADKAKATKIKLLEDDVKAQRELTDKAKRAHANEKQAHKAELGIHLKTIEQLKAEIDDVREQIRASDRQARLVEERLTSEAYLTAEMEKLLRLNRELTTRNDDVIKELEVEKDQMKELIQIHLDYEDELEERWNEIINNVEEIRKLQDQLQVQESVSVSASEQIRSLRIELEQARAEPEWRDKYHKLEKRFRQQESAAQKALQLITQERDQERSRTKLLDHILKFS